MIFITESVTLKTLI